MEHCKKQWISTKEMTGSLGKRPEKTPLFFDGNFSLHFFAVIFFGGDGYLICMGFCLQGSGIFVPRIIDLKHSNQLHLLVVEPTHLKNPNHPFCSLGFGVGLVLGAVLHLRLIGDMTGALGPGDVTGHLERVRLGLSCPAFFQAFCLPRGPAWRIIPVN